MSENRLSRREALARAAALAAMLPLTSSCAWPARSARFDAEAWLNAADAEAEARRSIAGSLVTRIEEETGGETALQSIRKAFGRITFLPRRLVDVSRLDLSSELLGTPLFTPLIIGPSKLYSVAHHAGLQETRRGAAIAHAAILVDSDGTDLTDADADAGYAPFWWCAATSQPIEKVLDTAARLQAHGCKALCVDLAESGAAERIASLRARASLPVIAKGAANVENTQAALAQGAHAVVLSALRILDTGEPDVISMLQRTLDAIAGRAPLIWSGGIQRGTDALAVIALGARAVMIDAPVLWGLAVHGAAGVERVVEVLQTELAYCMGMSGRPTLASVDRQLVRVHRADVASWPV